MVSFNCTTLKKNLKSDFYLNGTIASWVTQPLTFLETVHQILLNISREPFGILRDLQDVSQDFREIPLKGLRIFLTLESRCIPLMG